MIHPTKRIKPPFGLWALIFSGISTMIGSGWLFGAWKAARLAGPAAIWAWPIGVVAMLLLAYAYAELGARFPASGGMVRYTQMSHGSFAGFLAGWANWIAIVSVISIEAASSVQYMHSWPWHWAAFVYDPNTHALSHLGLALAVVLMGVYFLLNFWSVKLFMRSMVFITIFKVATPLLTIIALAYASLHAHSFDLVHHQFAPYGFAGVLTAVATAGIIFSFHGFQSPINLSGEARNPKRNVPLAIFISIGVCFVIYLILQMVFIGALSPVDIAHGWRNLDLSSPFVHLALAFNLNWLVLLIYIDAFVSPSGTGMTYTATTSRMLFAMQGNGYMPKIFGKLNKKYHVPRYALFANLVVGTIFLLLFKGWNSLISVISVATIISYLNGPVSAIALRKLKRLKHPVRIRGLKYVAPIAFAVITLVLYWARWPLTGEVIFIMLIGLPIYFYYQHKNHWENFKRDWRAGVWLVCYLLNIATISCIGSKDFGGMGWLDDGWSTAVIAVLALLYYCWGLRSSLCRDGEQPIT